MSFNSLTPIHTPYKNFRILSGSSVNGLLKNNKRLCLQTMFTKLKKKTFSIQQLCLSLDWIHSLIDRIHYDNFNDIHTKFVLYCGLSVVYKKKSYTNRSNNGRVFVPSFKCYSWGVSKRRRYARRTNRQNNGVNIDDKKCQHCLKFN